jgi:chromosome segregation ATPase
VIDDVSESKNKIKKLEDKKKLKTNDIENYFKQITEISTEIKILKNELSKIGTDQDECPICLRAITDRDLEHISERKNNINQNIHLKNKSLETLSHEQKELKSEIILIDRGIALLQDSVNKNILNQQQKKNDEEKIQYFNTQLSKEYKNLEDLKNYKDVENKSIVELQTEKDNLYYEIQDLKKHFKILENVKFVLSEEGVKSYVVKKILTLFNAKIAFYLK